MKNRMLAGAVALVSSVALGGCGYLSDSDPDSRTVTVWLMKNSVSQGFLDRFTQSYEEEHPPSNWSSKSRSGAVSAPRSWTFCRVRTPRTSSRSETPRSPSTRRAVV
ncbi:hypothetical protein NKH18_46855 [Streptomyces sp. M10(2022)]